MSYTGAAAVPREVQVEGHHVHARRRSRLVVRRSASGRVASGVTGLLFSLLLFSITAIPAPAKTLAIVIGVSEYESEELDDLKYSADDAAAIRDALVGYCGVAPENMWFLVDAQATRSAIMRAFFEVTRRAKQTDTVIIYIAGHGGSIPDRGDEGDELDHSDEVFLPYDTQKGFEDTYIIDDELGYLVSRFIAQSVVILMDTCHSGGQGRSVDLMGLGSRGSGDSMTRDVFSDPEARTGRAMLTACQSGEDAREFDELQHGVFTFFVLEGIENRLADANLDRVVTFDELGAFVSDAVDEWSSLQEGVRQVPYYENPSEQDIIIVPNVTIQPALCLSVDHLDLGSGQYKGVLEVRNCGNGILPFSVSVDESWLSVSPESGQVVDAARVINIVADVSQLPPGQYEATITVAPESGVTRVVRVDIGVLEEEIRGVRIGAKSLGWVPGVAVRWGFAELGAWWMGLVPDDPRVGVLTAEFDLYAIDSVSAHLGVLADLSLNPAGVTALPIIGASWSITPEIYVYADVGLAFISKGSSPLVPFVGVGYRF